ncbi:MAG TPA: hypothetical protein DF774_08470 [Rheinheimera sp.]|uniref:hypothetical protein n=1 Tax=Rheinheimera sp. TaxID=1869214 RepID=UPI000EE1D125|nr:hypothetical protein [Rheinheimera sp.]HCU65779.1 hypothetical protein [Rheinheimera sp.]
MIDSVIAKFVAVIDVAIAEALLVSEDAKQAQIEWLEEDALLVKSNFEQIKSELLSGTLAKSAGAGLGITRTISEMGLPDRLYHAGKKVEDFYINHW